jgi:hypothetical protein
MMAQQQRAMEAYRYRGYYGGLGDARPITSAIGSGLLSAGGVIAAIPGGQLPGAIVAAVGALTGLIGGLFAPDLTKVQATHIVDQIAAQVLEPNLAAWRSLPASQKTATNQAAFLEVVDAALTNVRQGCSNPALGTAGQKCISERLVRGGSAPWCPTGTGCDWYALYMDPIANDPNVVPDFAGGESVSSGSVSGAVDSAVSSVSTALGGVSPLWIGVGLIGLALFLVSD